MTTTIIELGDRFILRSKNPIHPKSVTFVTLRQRNGHYKEYKNHFTKILVWEVDIGEILYTIENLSIQI